MKNKGLHANRLANNPMEKLYAEHWEKINTESNSEGRQTLDCLLAIRPNDPRGEVTNRDKEVAATVIQWLGSSIGQYFVEQVQAEYKDQSRQPRRLEVK